MSLKAFTTAFFVTAILGGTACLIPSSSWAKGGGSSGGGSHGGSVSVHGYTRSNGIYVAPYTRSASGSGSRHSTGSGYSNNSEESGSSVDSRSTSATPGYFQVALDSARSTAAITQSAVSEDDWQLVNNKWHDAIFLLKQLPNSSPDYLEAQVKIQEYRRNLDYARRKLNLPPLAQQEAVAAQSTLNNKSQPNRESSTENSAPVAAHLGSPLPNTSIEPASSPVSFQEAAVTASVSRPHQVVPALSTEVEPEEDSNHFGGITSLIVLAVIIATGFYFYKAKQLKYSASKSIPAIKSVSVYPTNNYRVPKNYSVLYSEKVGVLERVGSVALGLGALVAFGLLNQKMGGSAGSAVRVKGYHKNNGTFVHSYRRHRPR